LWIFLMDQQSYSFINKTVLETYIISCYFIDDLDYFLFDIVRPLFMCISKLLFFVLRMFIFITNFMFNILFPYIDYITFYFVQRIGNNLVAIKIEEFFKIIIFYYTVNRHEFQKPSWYTIFIPNYFFEYVYHP